MQKDRFEQLMRQNYKVSLESAKKTLTTMMENPKEQDQVTIIRNAIASVEAVLANL